MKKRLWATWMALAVAASTLPAQAVFADDEGTPVFQDDFSANDLAANWSIDSGNWSIAAGKLTSADGTGSTKNRIKAKTAGSLKNVWLQMSFRMIGGQTNPYFRVYLRNAGGNDNTVVQFAPSGISAGIGSPGNAVLNCPDLFLPDTDYDIKIGMLDNTLEVYYKRSDEQGYALAGTATTVSTKAGTISIDASYAFDFDNLSVIDRGAGSGDGDGEPDTPPDAPSPIKHTLVIFQENHSFDNYFGIYPYNSDQFTPLPGSPHVNGIPKGSYNPDSQGNRVAPYPFPQATTSDPNHAYAGMISSYDQGKMDQYITTNNGNTVPMGYFDYSYLPAYWQYAQHFSMSDNLHQSIFGPSTPGALYLAGAQSGNAGKPNTSNPLPAYGPIGSSTGTRTEGMHYPSIGDRMDDKGVDWAWYQQGWSTGSIPTTNPFLYFDNYDKYNEGHNERELAEFNTDIDNGTFPAVAYVKSNSEHPGGGGSPLTSSFSVQLINKLMSSPLWKDSVIIIAYDESGGFWDHVPPAQVDPGPDGLQGLGPRSPIMVISPYAKKNYVSNVQSDTTSILKFIEWNYGLEPLNNRDTNAGSLLDMLDFKNPDFTPYLFRDASSAPKSSYGTAVNVKLNSSLLAESVYSEAPFTDMSGKIMVPAKSIARNINAVYKENNGKLTLIYNHHAVRLTVGSAAASIDGKAAELQDKVWLSPKNEVYLSLRELSDLPGFTVDLNSATPVITIK